MSNNHTFCLQLYSAVASPTIEKAEMLSPADRDAQLFALHLARVGWLNTSQAMKDESRTWLREQGYSTHLDVLGVRHSAAA